MNTKGDIIFSGKKTLKNRSIKENEFTFELYALTLKTDEDGNKHKITGTIPIETVKNREDGSYKFTEIKYTGEKDLDTDENGKYIETTKMYRIVEKNTGDKTVIYDSKVYDIVVVLKDNGQGKIEIDSDQDTRNFNFINTVVNVSKVDITSQKELVGAHIQVIDNEGLVIDEWTSTKEIHEVKNLKAGIKYILHETVAPDGYTITSDTTFTINEKGEVTSTGTTTTERSAR